MASTAHTPLHAAIRAVDNAFARLEAATDIALHERAESAANREAAQAQISQSWREHNAQLAHELAEAHSENEFLKQDNLRLSNLLRNLQQDYLDLQHMTGDAALRLDATVKQLDLVLEH